MGKIGIITYHSAYNYGSALQAFATQQAVEKVTGEKPFIIDYRTNEQQRVYAMYRTMHGPKILLEDLCLLPIHGKRSIRNKRFEEFFVSNMNLTKRVATSEEALKLFEKFDMMISGSDQIWNKYSLELANVDWKEMKPYLLSGFEGKKVSYASSIGNMSDEEILRIKEYIEKFDFVSFREKSSAERIRKLTSCNPAEVLDPTFLLSKDEWIKLLGLRKTSGKYILFYGLGGIGYLYSILKVLKPYAKRLGCKLKIVMPYAYLPFQGGEVEFCTDVGPIELLELIMNAQIVLTNSYHGTILSLNFEKEFYSICASGGTEFRKTEVLGNLGLKDRIISMADGENLIKREIEYSGVMDKLSLLRKESLSYLKLALN